MSVGHSYNNGSSTAPKNVEYLVIGAGVLGLSTANLLQTQHPDTKITIIADEFPVPSPMSRSLKTAAGSSPALTGKASPSYASMWAGAHYRPIPYIPSTHSTFATLSEERQKFHRQLAKEQAWAFRTVEQMGSIASNANGVQIVQGEEYLENPPDENLLLKSGDAYASRSGDDFRILDEEDLKELNSRRTAQVKWACSYQTYVVNVHMYCAWLLRQFAERGGRTIQRRLTKIEDAISSASRQTSLSSGGETAVSTIIVNCSGIGVTTDPNRNLIRGQTVLVRNSFPKTMTRQCSDGTWSFLIPRPCGGGTVIGGTKQIGDEYGLPRPEERRQLLENAIKYFPEFVERIEDFEVVCDNVGFRPGRQGGMRIQTEYLEGQSRGWTTKVVHAYGAGGRGYEISWGVAEEVCSMVGDTIDHQQDVPKVQRPRSNM